MANALVQLLACCKWEILKFPSPEIASHFGFQTHITTRELHMF